MSSSVKPTHKFIIANWKANPASLKDLEKIQKGYFTLQAAKHVSVIACPSPIHQILEFSKGVYVGAQDVSISGNATGSWSAAMLVAAGASHCIIGHSERRLLGETDIDVRNKMYSLLETGVVPIVCIGESLRDDSGKYATVIRHQLRLLFNGLTVAQMGRIIIAYEPVWAIGAKAARPCSAVECAEMVLIIREELIRIVPGLLSQHITIVYGGSVDSDNAGSYLLEGGVQGLLIGRASLDVYQMRSIIRTVESLP